MTRTLIKTAVALALAGAALAGCSTGPGTTGAPGVTSGGTGAYSDPQDIAPGKYPDRISNTSTQPGLTIANAMVENNVDPVSQQPVTDHLEVAVHNSTGTPMSGFEVFYTVTDTVTKQQESYDKILTGFTLGAGETKTVNLDNQPGPGHYGINTNGLYYKSTNALTFSVKISAQGFAPQTQTLSKSAGGAEKKD